MKKLIIASIFLALSGCSVTNSNQKFDDALFCQPAESDECQQLWKEWNDAYDRERKNREYSKRLNSYCPTGTVRMCEVTASRVARKKTGCSCSNL